MFPRWYEEIKEKTFQLSISFQAHYESNRLNWAQAQLSRKKSSSPFTLSPTSGSDIVVVDRQFTIFSSELRSSALERGRMDGRDNHKDKGKEEMCYITCKRCKKTYSASSNTSNSCRYHPSFFVCRRHDDQKRYDSPGVRFDSLFAFFSPSFLLQLAYE